MTNGFDLAYPQIEAQRPPNFAGAQAFERALLRLAVRDPAVHKLMVAVQHLLEPQSVLRDPELVERVQAVMGEGPVADVVVS